MRIFKNRGDFYISKNGENGSNQAKILFSLLAVIVIFTVVFVALLSQKYSTAAEFFGEGEVSTTELVTEDGETQTTQSLPSISGKTNFLIFETDNDQTSLHWAIIIQADKDNLAYKAAALPVNMKINNESLYKIYSLGGGAALQTKLTEYFGFEIDYYADFKYDAFVEFSNKLGTFVYSSIDEIIYSGGKDDDKYSLHIEEGDQKISGKELTNLLRYYSLEKKNYSLENELMLQALTQLFNENNYEDSESLFKLFIKGITTDITVRDFENGRDALKVFCLRNSDITLYTSLSEIENGVLTQKSVKDIKGYFAK